MADRVVLLSMPQLRSRDVSPGGLAALERLSSRGGMADLVPPFPGLTASAFATMVTGLAPHEHGAIGNSFFDRVSQQVVTAPLPDSAVHAMKLWHMVRQDRPGARVLLWCTANAQGADVDRNVWIDAAWKLRCCPESLAATVDKHAGPLPQERASAEGDPPFASLARWSLAGAAALIAEDRPDLAIVRLPYLGQVARRYGPDSREAGRAVTEFDGLLGPFLDDLPGGTAVLAVTESIVTPVTTPIYPNRVLREMGLLRMKPGPDGRPDIDLASSAAFALSDHQICHIYLNDPHAAGLVASNFSGLRSEGIDLVIASEEQRAMIGLDHPRSGDVILVACPDSWFAPAWWLQESERPDDPFGSALPSWTAAGRPLDAGLVCGSLGAPPPNELYYGLVICSEPGLVTAGDERPVSSGEVVTLVRRLLTP